ncbi:hypothetical protein [Legionella spiritensis]|uniref:hypothetical protein n=1 Tax=Legionella spiritensis TaxID=452 RepID=UPI000F6E61C2|nr:hypothetical protein [Legionella spiritensis]VEG92333.1 Uncharacterised protein [Legionella spiritensis]
MAKLTDNLLTQVYLGLVRDYKELSQQSPRLDFEQIYHQLYNRLYWSMQSSMNPLSGLSPEEKDKVWGVFYCFINACPQYVSLPRERQGVFFNNPVRVVVIEERYHYCSSNDSVFTWLMLGSLMSHSHHYGYHHYHSSSHHHGHGVENTDGNGLLLLLLVALALLAAILAFVSLYYLISQSLNAVERFVYNEGWLQASFSMAGMLGGAAAGGLLGAFVASAPLAALAIGAGISNPVGITIVGIICLTLIGAAAGCFLTNQIVNYALKKKNQQALDPADPRRFELTGSEETDLLDKGLNPIAVRCAIVALREQMGEKGVPSLLNRVFTSRGQETQEILSQIRELRRGSLRSINVGDMTFHLELPHYVPPVWYSTEPTPQEYGTGYSPSRMEEDGYHTNRCVPCHSGYSGQPFPTPSAPPYYQ